VLTVEGANADAHATAARKTRAENFMVVLLLLASIHSNTDPDKNERGETEIGRTSFYCEKIFLTDRLI
jgi:pullulanase/glycogen debranching enzyme